MEHLAQGQNGLFAGKLARHEPVRENDIYRRAQVEAEMRGNVDETVAVLANDLGTRPSSRPNT